MKFYTRPNQRAFPFTRQQFKWRRFKRATFRAVQSEWFNVFVFLMMVLTAVLWSATASL